MDIYTEFLALLGAAIEREGNAVNLGKRIGLVSNQLTRWNSRSRVPTLANIQPVLDYWGAELVWPEKRDGKTIAATADKPSGEGESSRVFELESTVAKLQAELATTRSERDEARGEVRALERQLARLIPTHEERNESSPDSTGDIHGEAVRAG